MSCIPGRSEWLRRYSYPLYVAAGVNDKEAQAMQCMHPPVLLIGEDAKRERKIHVLFTVDARFPKMQSDPHFHIQHHHHHHQIVRRFLVP